MERDKLFEEIINSFRNICDNKITFVYPNITENKKGDIQRFLNRPIEERIAFFCDTHKDDGKHNILITEKGIYDKFDYYLISVGFGLHLGTSKFLSHDLFFPWEKINRIEFSEKEKHFYFYFDEGYDTYWKIGRWDLLYGYFSVKECVRIAYNLTQFAHLFQNEKEIVDEIFELEKQGNYKLAVKKADDLVSSCNEPEVMCFLKYVRGRMYLGYANEEEVTDDERVRRLSIAENDLSWALSNLDNDWKEYEDAIRFHYGTILFWKNEYLQARKNLLYAMGSDNENIVTEAREGYKICEEELKETWEHYTEKVEYNKRQYILPVKDIEGCADTEIETFSIDKLPSDIQFPVGHPKINVLYIGHPYRPHIYIPYNESEDSLFVDKVQEFCYLLQCLGAKEIRILSVIGKSVNELSKYSLNAQLGGSGKVYGGDVKGDYANENHSAGETLQHLEMLQKFEPNKPPFIPEGLIWYPHNVQWQRLAKSRIDGNLLEYGENISTEETSLFSEQSEMELQAHFKALIAKANVNAKTNSSDELKKHTKTEWRVEVKFCSIKEFEDLVDQNPQIASQEPKQISSSQLTEDEQSYAEEVKFCLEDGAIGDKERRFLERMRTKLGISPERAAEIEKSLQRPQLTEDEQEYLDAVKEEIVDGVIPDSSRRLLSRLRRSMNISEERAKEIENYLN